MSIFQFLNWTYKLQTWYQCTTTWDTFTDCSEVDLDINWRSQVKVKGHKNEPMVISSKLLPSKISYLVPRHNTISHIYGSNDISFLDLVIRSTSHVKGQSSGGVCVLRMLLVFITSPRNRGGVIFSLQFVCLCVFVCVCPFVNKMPIEPLHRFQRGLR